MPQRFVPAVFMRGGTSKGLFFQAKDLPADQEDRDRVLLAALGSPDPFGRQLDGMGGGLSSLSKAALIGPPTRCGADVDYSFAQVAVDRPVVDLGANCGNLSSAVGPYAVDQGLCPRTDGPALVRIHNTNTGGLIHARFAVRGGCAETRVLPTGRPVDGALQAHLGRGHEGNRVGRVHQRQPQPPGAIQGYLESPEELEARPDVIALLDRLRRQAGVLMGLAPDPVAVELANPKIALLCPPRPFRTLDGRLVAAADHDIGVRMLSMERAHRAVPVTGALCVGVASRVAGTVAQALARPAAAGDPVRVGNPSGVVQVAAQVVEAAGRWRAESATLYRTARTLMRGQVAVPTG
jgi:2-methylaconitate cis-trans-isomerase PrpF